MNNTVLIHLLVGKSVSKLSARNDAKCSERVHRRLYSSGLRVGIWEGFPEEVMQSEFLARKDSDQKKKRQDSG